MRLEWIFFMQIVMGIAMFVLLQKLNQMKKKIDEITKEVTNYISYITEDLEKEVENEPSIKEKSVSKGREEAQNRLIQAVLGEYFP